MRRLFEYLKKGYCWGGCTLGPRSYIIARAGWAKRHITLHDATISPGQKSTDQSGHGYSNSKYVNSNSQTCQASESSYLTNASSHIDQKKYKLKHMLHYLAQICSVFCFVSDVLTQVRLDQTFLKLFLTIPFYLQLLGNKMKENPL